MKKLNHHLFEPVGDEQFPDAVRVIDSPDWQHFCATVCDIIAHCRYAAHVDTDRLPTELEMVAARLYMGARQLLNRPPASNINVGQKSGPFTRADALGMLVGVEVRPMFRSVGVPLSTHKDGPAFLIVEALIDYIGLATSVRAVPLKPE